ncbi:DNA primase [Hazenella coriacea]|nr:DNA primase [Hazenella coriacea]
MGVRIPEEVIDRVRKHFDIVDIVQSYVQLKKSGRNYFGLCPFHSERTPSFSVSPDKQIFHCFGCGVGGDTIKFMMEIEQLTFVEAVQYLAERAGIPLPEIDSSLDHHEEEERRQLRNALKLASQLYHHILLNTKHGDVARKYLANRQISRQTIEEFQLGYAPPSYEFLLSFLLRRGFQEDILVKAGLVALKDTPSQHRCFDRFRNRLMFPLHDSQGRVIGFAGRLLGEGRPKYLNTPETVLFHKGTHLFNLHRARTFIRKEDQAILFEGYMDVISAWQSGIYQVVATQGTSLTDDQAKVIRRNAESAIICYDADLAGQNAAARGLEILRQHGLTIKVAQVPLGKDPDEYIREFGGNAFKEEILAGTLSLTAFKLESLKKNYQLQDEDQRLQYLHEAIHVITDLPMAIEQDHYLRKLAEEFSLSLDAIKEEQRKVRKKKNREKNRDKEQAKWNNGYREHSKHMLGLRKMSMAEKSEMYLVAYMMRSKYITQWAKKHVGAEFHMEVYAALAAYLYAYYEQDVPDDVGRFISTLKDPSLIPKASELAMLDLPEEVSEDALNDYAWHIQSYPVLKEIEKKEKMVEQLTRADEHVKAAQLSIEINQLRKQLQMRT